MVKLVDLTAVYEQEGDSAGGEDFQNLEIATANAGGGVFFILKTDRWAFENEKEFIDLLKDFKKRMGVKTNVAVFDEQIITKKET